MIYLVTEDSTSAREFWKCVLHVFRGENNYKVHPLPSSTAGNTTLESQVNRVLLDMSSGDELFVAFDNVYMTELFDPAEFIIATLDKCEAAGISFYYTDYYCFEEIFIAYEELLRLAKIEISDKILLNALQFAHDCIYRGEDYFYSDSDYILRFVVEELHIEVENREHLANHILLNVTKRLNEFFGIIKSAKCFEVGGRCWLQDCAIVQRGITEQHKNNMCDKCGYKCKGMTVSDKLIDLSDNTYRGEGTVGLKDI